MDFDLSWKRLSDGKSGRIVLLRLAALVFWLAAALVLSRAAVRSRETPVRIRFRLGELKALAALDDRVAAWQGARAAFIRESHSDRPYDLPAQAVLAVGGTETNQVRELSRTRIAGGWEAVQVQVRAESMALAALSPLIETGESADPPWRLTAITVEPLSPKPGKGRVSMEFETLVREPSGLPES